MMKIVALLALLLSSCASNPTLLRTCPAGYRQSCPPDSVVRWRSIPITVSDEGRFGVALTDAVAFWNRELGMQMFTVRSGATQVRVLPAPDAGGGTRHNFDGDTLVGADVFCGGGDLRLRYLIIAHELGHVIGLEDDNARTRSVMAIDVADGIPISPDTPWRTILVESQDRTALRNLYR